VVDAELDALVVETVEAGAAEPAIEVPQATVRADRESRAAAAMPWRTFTGGHLHVRTPGGSGQRGKWGAGARIGW